ncbi:putative bifunctional diguanylate cyclase/phosphodiesterase [Hyphomonas neptunium]|nr:EAL domain-containing protein [Hyphomonas hirschiana]
MQEYESLSQPDWHPMPYVRKLLILFLAQYRLGQLDMDLARAQFREFVHQVPLLYFILSCNAVAVAAVYGPLAPVLLSCVFPFVLCTVAAVRGLWWSRRQQSNFSDTEITRHIRTTGRLAVLMTAGFMIWGLLLYPYGDLEARAHLTFFLALTQVSTVFCLMPLRSAALSVATVATPPFFVFFLFADQGRMMPEAIMMAVVAAGMINILYRHNGTFSKLISSRRILRQRQLDTQQLSDENRRIAFTDPLSGLPNRRAMLARLEALSASGPCGPDRLAVVFIDLDGFKVVNDLHGHAFGDKLVTQVGAALKSLISDETLLVRMGGDEFAALLAGPDAAARAERLGVQALNCLTLPLTVDGRQVRIGASIGIAVDAAGNATPLELLRQADAAMYDVKSHGKGGIRVFDPGLDAGRDWRLQIEKELAHGLEQEEFDVVYQPLVDAADFRISGVEALLRWPGRAAGPLAPDAFIEVAEGSGLIQALGMYVLEKACRDLHALPDLKLSVNVSPTQFSHPDFAKQVVAILRQTRFSARRLQLEITERHLIDHPERAHAAIAMLKRRGVTFALDDFGTGFTSLAYLQSYGFGCVKINRSLIGRLETDPKAGYLISGIVMMARGLDIKVVAEGVETERLARKLQIARCDLLQGYYFGRPAAIDRLKADVSLAGRSTEAA